MNVGCICEKDANSLQAEIHIDVKCEGRIVYASKNNSNALYFLRMLVSSSRPELRSWPPRARTVAGGASALALVYHGLEDLYLAP